MLDSPTLSRERGLFLVVLVEEGGVLGDLLSGLKNAWRVLMVIEGPGRSTADRLLLCSSRPNTPRGWVDGTFTFSDPLPDGLVQDR